MDACGEVVRPVANMGEMVGFFRVTEGNRIGIHKPHER